MTSWIFLSKSKFVGNNVKGQISKRVLQENRARQMRGMKSLFFEKYGVFCFLVMHVLRVALFALLPTSWSGSMSQFFSRKLYSLSYISISRILSVLVVADLGQEKETKCLKRIARWSDLYLFCSSRILVGILFGSLLLSSFKEEMLLKTSELPVRVIKNDSILTCGR